MAKSMEGLGAKASAAKRPKLAPSISLADATAIADVAAAAAAAWLDDKELVEEPTREQMHACQRELIKQTEWRRCVVEQAQALRQSAQALPQSTAAARQAALRPPATGSPGGTGTPSGAQAAGPGNLPRPPDAAGTEQVDLTQWE